MSIVYTSKLNNTGLGDKLVHLHNTVHNSTSDDVIIDSQSDPISLFFKSQIIQKRIFVHSDTNHNPTIPQLITKDLQLFSPGESIYDVYVEWPKLYEYDFLSRVANMKKGKEKERLIKHLLKRSFTADWHKPNREGKVIHYNETDIVNVFNIIKNARIVYGPEGGIYHLSVYFNKPYVMIIPNKIINCRESLRNAAFKHIYYKHPTYKHRFISESLYNKFTNV